MGDMVDVYRVAHKGQLYVNDQQQVPKNYGLPNAHP
jgi:hypothetical protein